MNLNDEKDFYFKIEGNLDYIEGRISIFPVGAKFNSEINLVFVETGKIYKNVKNLFDISDEDEILNLSIQELKNYLSRLTLN